MLYMKAQKQAMARCVIMYCATNRPQPQSQVWQAPIFPPRLNRVGASHYLASGTDPIDQVQFCLGRIPNVFPYKTTNLAVFKKVTLHLVQHRSKRATKSFILESTNTALRFQSITISQKRPSCLFASVLWMLEVVVERAGTFKANLQGFRKYL